MYESPHQSFAAFAAAILSHFALQNDTFRYIDSSVGTTQLRCFSPPAPFLFPQSLTRIPEPLSHNPHYGRGRGATNLLSLPRKKLFNVTSVNYKADIAALEATVNVLPATGSTTARVALKEQGIPGSATRHPNQRAKTYGICNKTSEPTHNIRIKDEAIQ